MSTTPHKASAEQWEQCASALIERLSRLEEGYDELAARFEALEREAAMNELRATSAEARPAAFDEAENDRRFDHASSLLEQPDKLDRLIAQDRAASSLVERVCQAPGPRVEAHETAMNELRAAELQLGKPLEDTGGDYEFINGVVMNDGTVVSTTPLADGSYNVVAWSPTDEMNDNCKLTIANGQGSPVGIAFVIKIEKSACNQVAARQESVPVFGAYNKTNDQEVIYPLKREDGEDRLSILPAPADSLVKRVRDAIDDASYWDDEAQVAIRAIATWMRDRGGYPWAWVAMTLEKEAER